jgi:hypothetical protein
MSAYDPKRTLAAGMTVSLARKQEADNDQGNEESGTKR